MSDPVDSQSEILQDFLIEAEELIEKIDEDLIHLESAPGDADLINEVFRSFHTIKGTSSFLGLTTITTLAHRTEEVLNGMRRGDLILTAEIMDVILESVDLHKLILEKVRNSEESDVDLDPVLQKLEQIEQGEMGGADDGTQAEEAGTEEESPVPSDSEPEAPDEMSAAQSAAQEELDRLFAEACQEVGADAIPVPEPPAPGVPEAAGSGEEAPAREEQKKESPAPPVGPAEPGPPAPKVSQTTPETSQTIRVGVDRLEFLFDMVGELVLSRNRLARIFQRMEQGEQSKRTLEELSTVTGTIDLLTNDLQLAVMKTRLVSIGRIFNKFPRMIRDLARELKKSIDLHITGADTELDRSVVEMIGDPLVHLLRNSVDHGIEDPETRESCGKPREGRIDLSAYYEGDYVIIEIEDDGRGMNLANLKDAAVARGVIKAEEAESLPKREVLNLIFAPGFSTAESVSKVSGRGVGMDVVRSHIQNINGLIVLDSEEGRGTRVMMKIPNTLAIAQVLLVRTGGEIFAVPLISVIEVLALFPSEVESIEGKAVLRFRDAIVSLVWMDELFSLERDEDDGGGRRYVVVVGLADKRVGLVVDEVLGKEEVVIKSIGSYAAETEGISGATVMGDGRVCLIADISSMIHMAMSRGGSTLVPGAGEDSRELSSGIH